MKKIDKKVKSSPKIGVKSLNEWKKKMEEPSIGNFRQRAERAGVPPEKVKDFKHWLIEQRNG